MDAMRAAAAVAVVLSHSRDLLMIPYQPRGSWFTLPFYALAGLAHEAVIAFFVLSGYWISRSVERRSPDGFWSDYLIDRLSRLWIVIIPALGLTLALDSIGLAIGAPVYADATGADSVNPVKVDPSAYVGTLLFLQSMLVPPAGSNGPLWSLAWEFWFYIWFAALWLALKHRRFGIALVSVLLGALYPAIAIGFMSWLCGSALHFATRDRDIGQGAALSALLGGGIVALVAVALRWPDVVLAASFALALYGVLGLRIGWPDRLAAISRFGANASFTLYATHMPVVLLGSTLFVWSDRLEPTPAAMAAVIALAALAITVAAALARVTEAKRGSLKLAAKSCARQMARAWR